MRLPTVALAALACFVAPVATAQASALSVSPDGKVLCKDSLEVMLAFLKEANGEVPFFQSESSDQWLAVTLTANKDGDWSFVLVHIDGVACRTQAGERMAKVGAGLTAAPERPFVILPNGASGGGHWSFEPSGNYIRGPY